MIVIFSWIGEVSKEIRIIEDCQVMFESLTSFDKRENQIDIISLYLILLFYIRTIALCQTLFQMSFMSVFFHVEYEQVKAESFVWWKWRQEQFFLLLCSFSKVSRRNILLTFCDRYIDYKNRTKTDEHRHRMVLFQNSKNIYKWHVGS